MRYRAIGAIAVLLAAMTPVPAAAADIRPAPGTPVYQRIDLRSIDPQLRPFMLGKPRDVTVVVQLSGDPVAAVQAGTAERGGRLSMVERASIRQSLRARQDALRPALRSVGARILGQFADAYNGIKVRVSTQNLTRLVGLPGVIGIAAVPIYHLSNATSEAYTGVPGAWSAPNGVTGKGVRIAVIDSGIDYHHADFGGSGDPADFEADAGLAVGTPAFPNAKVAGGFDFVGDAYDPEGFGDSVVPHPDPNPLDCDGHGTHVAATAAGYGVTNDGRTYRGPYDAQTLSRQHFKVAPGVAPGAQIYALRVFGCSGSTDVVLDAIDWAVKNRIDVINLSLGTTFGAPDSPDARAVDNAVRAGIAVVASAGNEGPGPYTVAAPGVAAGAISVAAVDAVRLLPGVSIGLQDTGFQATNANRATGFPLTGRLRVLSDGSGGIGLGCSRGDYAAVQAGDIVVTLRGLCPRIDRATLGQQAGAAAVVMVNNTPTDRFPPIEGPIPDVTIPFIGAKAVDGPSLQAADGQNIWITGGLIVDNPGFGGSADFTSVGPSSGTSALKPDIAAPGVAVLSAAIGTGTDGIVESGTSMSSPHVAGIAALVLQAHPAWSPGAVKAAIMNTASDGIAGFDVRVDGNGLVQAQPAVEAVATATTARGSASLSFGDRALAGAYTASQTITLSNAGGSPIPYRLSSRFTGPRLGASMTITPSLVTVPGHRSIRIIATLSLSAAAVAALPSASDPHATLTEIRGAITATPTHGGSGIFPLRVPFLLVPRGLSNVVAPAGVTLGQPDAKGRSVASARLMNTGVHAGVADVFAWGLRAGSLGAGSMDVRAIGVQSLGSGLDGRPLPADARLLVFAINTYTAWSTPSVNEFDIAIDSTGSGSVDYVLSVLDHGLATGGAPDGRMACVVFRIADLAVLDAVYAKAGFNSATLRCAVLTSALAPMAAGQPFAYLAESTSGEIAGRGFFGASPLVDVVPGVGWFDAFQPAVSQGDNIRLAAGRTAKVRFSVDSAALANAPTLGWMIVSPDDAAGSAQAETIPLVLPTSP